MQTNEQETAPVKDHAERADDFYKEAEEVKETESDENGEAGSQKDESESTDQSEGAQGEEKSEESKDSKTDEAKESEESEIEYKLSLEEGSYLDESYLEEVTEFAKENKLTNEAAQALVSKQNEALAKIVQKAEDAEEQQIETWRQEVIADPIMGGDNLAKTSENAKRVIEKFGNQEIIDLLEETGYGNNPHIVKLLATIGEQMSEDSLIFSGTQGAADITPEDKFYSSN